MAQVEFDSLRPGDRIDAKYEVQQVLGKGGMGVVLAALHLDLQERVALKFLLPQAAGRPDSLERFLREARSMRKLKSEHVVKVLDVGRLSDSGLPYMAMEFLDGADLSKVLEWKGRLPTEVACDFILQACDAIGEAHSLGIIHRDIKPANLFALRTKGQERALIKILDFGIAKVIDAEGPGGTRTQAVMGSAFYMSPEQMRSTKKVDARTDIWALGITLYEMLTLRHPFQGVSVPEVVLSISNDPPIPPHIYLPDLPAGLEAIILRCLEKDPEARFRTAGDLAAALAPYAGHGATELASRVQSRGSFAEIQLDERLPVLVSAAYSNAPTMSVLEDLSPSRPMAPPVVVMREVNAAPVTPSPMLQAPVTQPQVIVDPLLAETFQAPLSSRRPAQLLAEPSPVVATPMPLVSMTPGGKTSSIPSATSANMLTSASMLSARKKKLSLGVFAVLSLAALTLLGATFGSGAYGASPSATDTLNLQARSPSELAQADHASTDATDRTSETAGAADSPAASSATAPSGQAVDALGIDRKSASSSQNRPSTTKGASTHRTPGAPAGKPSSKGRASHNGTVD